jgi:hypothetical protein
MRKHTASLSLTFWLALGGPLSGQGVRAPSTGEDSLQLNILILRTAVSLGTESAHPASLPRLVCLSQVGPEGPDPSPATIAALQQPDSLVLRPVSHCRQDLLNATPTDIPLLVDTLTSKRGIRVSASQPVFASDGTFTVYLEYYEHRRSAGGWGCIGRREQSGWRITECKLSWIS